MRQRHKFGTIMCLVVLIISAAVAAQGDLREKVGEATEGFRDVTITARVVHANHAALAEIGQDFSKSYDIKTSTVWFKAPDKMRMEGKLGLVRFLIVINGDTKAFEVPMVHYCKKEDIKGEPHKRQTELDLGILTDSLWKDYIVTNTELEHSADGPAYKIVFVRSNARKKKIIIWADAKSLKMLKMEKYDDDGSLKSKCVYSDHKEFHGIWVPGRIDVYNKDGKLAGSTVYEDIKVNSGVPDSLFVIK